MGMRDWSAHGIGIVKPMFYARAAASAQAVAPALTLDIVPAGGEQYQVWFQGKPLAKTGVTVYAPNGWWQEHRTDAEGRVQLARPIRHRNHRAGKNRQRIRGQEIRCDPASCDADGTAGQRAQNLRHCQLSRRAQSQSPEASGRYAASQ